MTLSEFYERLRDLAQDAAMESGSQALSHCAVVLLSLQAALVGADEKGLRLLSDTAGRLSLAKVEKELAMLRQRPS